MKRMILLLLAVAWCAGCASRYNIILNSGEVVTARGKPQFNKDKGGYIYTDANGNKDFISLGHVREVAPASMSKNAGMTYDLNDLKK